MARVPSLFISIFFVFFTAIPAFSSEEKGLARFERGHHEWGTEIGYGVGHSIPGDDPTDIQFARIAANYQLDLTGNIGTSYYQGNLNWYAELNVDLLHQPDFGTLVGFSPMMFQYKFVKPERKWAPTLLAGAGLALTDWDEDDLADQEISGSFQFILHGGAGIEYFRPDHSSFSINYRFFHVSNAGIKSPNLGLNASLFTLGFSF